MYYNRLAVATDTTIPLLVMTTYTLTNMAFMTTNMLVFAKLLSNALPPTLFVITFLSAMLMGWQLQGVTLLILQQAPLLLLNQCTYRVLHVTWWTLLANMARFLMAL